MTETSASQSAKDDGKTYTIRIAIVSSDSHLHNTVLNEWAQEAKEKTNGRLILKVMGSSQLGGERDYAVSYTHLVQAEVARVTRSLGSDGRILLRQSGTEPVVRVMVEAPDIQTCETYVDQVIQVMKDRGHCI